MKTKQRNLKIGIRILRHAFMHQLFRSARSWLKPTLNEKETLFLLDSCCRRLQDELHGRFCKVKHD